MTLNELNDLAHIANHRENVLKNNTTELRNEVRDWCVEEMKKIEAEEKKLVDFVNANSRIFCDKCGSPLLYKVGIRYEGHTGYEYVIFNRLTMSDTCCQRWYNTYERFYNSTSVYSWTTKCQGVPFAMEQDIEYWTKMKDVIDFRRWQLNTIVENLKILLDEILNNQNNRMDCINNVCNDIVKEMDDTEDVSLTITIKGIK